MPASSLPHALPVHPHQLEVQEFDSYALIIDLRPAEAFVIDHIPRAISVPWRSGVFAPGRAVTGVETGLAVPAAMEPAQGLPYALEARLGSLDVGSAVLLYCDKGGALSADVAAGLAGRGVSADVLPGGWASYRRWVGAGIEVLARALDWRWIRSAPGGASQALVRALLARGEQALEASALFDHILTPGLIADPSQIEGPSFESRLVDVLRRFDPAVRVWADEVMALSGEQVLPTPFDETLRHAERWRVETPIDCRADLLAATLHESGRSAASLLNAISPAKPGPIADALADVRRQVGRVDERELLATLLGDVLDPLYGSLSVPDGGGRERPLWLASGTPVVVDQLAAQLSGGQISP